MSTTGRTSGPQGGNSNVVASNLAAQTSLINLAAAKRNGITDAELELIETKITQANPKIDDKDLAKYINQQIENLGLINDSKLDDKSKAYLKKKFIKEKIQIFEPPKNTSYMEQYIRIFFVAYQDKKDDLTKNEYFFNSMIAEVEKISLSSKLNDTDKEYLKEQYIKGREENFDETFRDRYIDDLIDQYVEDVEKVGGREIYFQILKDEKNLKLTPGTLVEVTKNLRGLIDDITKVYNILPDDVQITIQEILYLLMSVVKTVQGLAASLAESLKPVTERLNIYTKLKTQVKIYTSNDKKPDGTAYGPEQLTELNNKAGRLVETLGAFAGLEGDKAKELQTKLQTVNEFAKKVQDFFSAFIDLLRAIFTKITQ